MYDIDLVVSTCCCENGFSAMRVIDTVTETSMYCNRVAYYFFNVFSVRPNLNSLDLSVTNPLKNFDPWYA